MVAGYEHLQQSEQHGAVPYSSVFAYLASLSVETNVGALLLGLDIGAGGSVFRLDDGGGEPETVHRPPGHGHRRVVLGGLSTTTQRVTLADKLLTTCRQNCGMLSYHIW